MLIDTPGRAWAQNFWPMILIWILNPCFLVPHSVDRRKLKSQVEDHIDPDFCSAQPGLRSRCPKFWTLQFWGQTLKLKRFRAFSGKCFHFFPVCFLCFSGLFLERFRKKKNNWPVCIWKIPSSSPILLVETGYILGKWGLFSRDGIRRNEEVFASKAGSALGRNVILVQACFVHSMNPKCIFLANKMNRLCVSKGSRRDQCRNSYCQYCLCPVFRNGPVLIKVCMRNRVDTRDSITFNKW